MASLMSLGCAACERRFQGMNCPCSACQFGGRSQYSLGTMLSASASAPQLGSVSESTMQPTMATTAGPDWLLPLPPVRFPLRDALMSLQDTSSPPTERSRSSIGSNTTKKKTGGKSLLTMSTEKSRALTEIGRLRRKGEWRPTAMEVEPVITPRAPAECDKPKPAPKAVSSIASKSRVEARRTAEATATDSKFPVLEEPLPPGQAPKDYVPGDDIRSTWTSAARAVLSHSWRQEGASASSLFSGLDPVQVNSLRPVQEWAGRDHAFTDMGLGIGPRGMDQEIKNMVKRSPGPTAYVREKAGSVSLWSSDAPLPTKQPLAQHHSTEAHRIGVRREKVHHQDNLLGPGTYELKGFTDELLSKAPRRPKGRDRDIPPPTTFSPTRQSIMFRNIVAVASPTPGKSH